jgi:transposase
MPAVWRRSTCVSFPASRGISLYIRNFLQRRAFNSRRLVLEERRHGCCRHRLSCGRHGLSSRSRWIDVRGRPNLNKYYWLRRDGWQIFAYSSNLAYVIFMASSTDSPPTMAQTQNRSKHMTDYQKGMIDAYHDMGASSIFIGKKLGKSPSTIRSYLAKRELHGYETRKRTGRPRKISQRTARQLTRSVKLDSKQKYATLRNDIAPEVSIRTIQRRLRERNTHKWIEPSILNWSRSA